METSEHKDTRRKKHGKQKGKKTEKGMLPSSMKGEGLTYSTDIEDLGCAERIVP